MEHPSPTFDDYAQTIRSLFHRYQQDSLSRKGRGRMFTYTQITLILFFTIMIFRRITKFKTQRRWLENHPKEAESLGFPGTPHRTTISRRYKVLYPTVQEFVDYVGQWAEGLDEAFRNDHLFEDKSLFKANGTVWHSKDQKAGIIPEGLRNVDKDATWCKSEYHGWVYGYGLHSTCAQSGFPKHVQVETASVPESTVLDEKADKIQHISSPETLNGDDGYSKLSRVKEWVKTGTVILTPLLKGKSREAKAYHAYLEFPENASLMRKRKTAIEPLFDLVSKVIGTEQNHKQLHVKGIANVRTCLALGVLMVQIAMIVNNVWGLPLHNISHMLSVFT
jgi:hypothetical protein